MTCPGAPESARPGKASTIILAATVISIRFHSPSIIACRSLFSFQGALSIPGIRVWDLVGKKAQKLPASCRLLSTGMAQARGTSFR